MEIRLVKIRPNADAKKPVQLLMRCFDLAQEISDRPSSANTKAAGTGDSALPADRIDRGSVQFRALSYVWGPELPLNDVLVDAGDHVGWLSVRRNLHDFLITRRDPGTLTPWFWIDQLCINQTDDHEKGHQVNQMSEIYKKAEEVELWLGPAFPGSDDVMDYILMDSVDKYEWLSDLNLTSPGEYAALQDLAQLPYWSRSWIVQEILLGRKTTVLLGTHSATWPKDFNASYQIDTRYSPSRGGLEPGRKYTPLDLLLDSAGHEVRSNHDWRSVLFLAVNRHCADVRDNVYAMMGLVLEPLRFYLDYTMDLQDVLLTVLRRQLGIAIIYPTMELQGRSALEAVHHFQTLAVSWILILDRQLRNLDPKALRHVLLEEVHHSLRDSLYPSHFERQSLGFPRYGNPLFIIGVGKTPLVRLRLWWTFPSGNSIRWYFKGLRHKDTRSLGKH